MASITYREQTVPLIEDMDEWTAAEIFGVERMISGGMESTETVGRMAAIAGVSISRVVRGFAFPDSVLAMKGKELAGIVKATIDALSAEMEAQEAAKLAQAAGAVEGEILSPTSAESGSTPLSA